MSVHDRREERGTVRWLEWQAGIPGNQRGLGHNPVNRSATAPVLDNLLISKA